MQLALDLARRGEGFTRTNPLVGCVVVRDGRVLGQGWHQVFGGPHAEVNALADAARAAGAAGETGALGAAETSGLAGAAGAAGAEGTDAATGATLYVTLEPCCHTGKTPPCTELIIKCGIARVVVGVLDPHDKVAGKGVARLRDAGIEVSVGVLEEQCRALNEAFFYSIARHKPFVLLKAAMSADGKIATRTGESQWISSEASRAYAHEYRRRLEAIMVGIGTVLADDPSLTYRGPQAGLHPTRVIVDSRLRIPLDAKVFLAETPLILATASNPDPEKLDKLSGRPGVEVIVTSGEGQVNLPELMDALYARDIGSVLLEGGGGLNDAMLRAGLVGRLMLFVCPLLIGSAQAKTPVEGEGFASLAQSLRCSFERVWTLGGDVVLEARCLPA